MGCYIRRPSRLRSSRGAPIDRDFLLRYLFRGKWGYDQTLDSVIRFKHFLMCDPAKYNDRKMPGFGGYVRQKRGGTTTTPPATPPTPLPTQSAIVTAWPTVTSGTAQAQNVVDLGGFTYAAATNYSSLSYVTFKNGYFITHGIQINSATNVIFDNCVFDMAVQQVVMTGGNRTTLAGSGCIIRNCVFKNCTNVYAVALDGVGHLVDTCLFQDCGGRALQFGGPVGANDSICQNSTFTRCATTINDCGAIYTGGNDCGQAGLQFLNNTFNGIVGPGGGQTATWCMYWDSHSGHNTAIGNTFNNCLNGIIINGGRDNFIGSNTFNTCTRYGVEFSDRDNDTWPLVSKCLQDITTSPYAKYPYLALLAGSQGLVNGFTCYTGDSAIEPIGNVIQSNSFVSCGTAVHLSAGTTFSLVNTTARAQDNVGYVGNSVV